MSENTLPTILVVDDEEVIRITIQKKLSRMGFNVISFEKGEDLLYYLKNADHNADLIITDIKLRKMDGIEETVKFPLPKGLKNDAKGLNPGSGLTQ